MSPIASFIRICLLAPRSILSAFAIQTKLIGNPQNKNTQRTYSKLVVYQKVCQYMFDILVVFVYQGRSRYPPHVFGHGPDPDLGKLRKRNTSNRLADSLVNHRFTTTSFLGSRVLVAYSLSSIAPCLLEPTNGHGKYETEGALTKSKV